MTEENIENKQNEALLNDTTQDYERLANQYAKNKAGEIINTSTSRAVQTKLYKTMLEKNKAGEIIQTKLKRAVTNQAYNDVIKDVRNERKLMNAAKLNKKIQNKNAFGEFATALKEHRDWKIFKSLPKRANVEAQASNINTRNEILTKSLNTNNDVSNILQKAIKKDNKIKNISKFGQLSSGALKQEKQITASMNAANIKQRKTNISNFAKLASQTKKIKEVRQNKQIQTARKQYNKIGENMMKRDEAILRPANRELIQSKARDKVKKYQDQISHADTRSKLPQETKNKTIENANRKIAMLDKIIKKKSNAGRPRTRTGTDEATGSVGPRLSMLSSTSTQGAAFTPKRL